jgi:hypothetical protein
MLFLADASSSGLPDDHFWMQFVLAVSLFGNILGGAMKFFGKEKREVGPQPFVVQEHEKFVTVPAFAAVNEERKQNLAKLEKKIDAQTEIITSLPEEWRREHKADISELWERLNQHGERIARLEEHKDSHTGAYCQTPTQRKH